MAYLESAVVVYLRELYYPNGFEFPIILIPTQIAVVEIGREAATIFMLIAIAFLTGKNTWTRFAYFMFCFGVWDIWYYIWLKIFLNWPASFLTWDLLFLIPVPWVGPVLAPIIVSVSLIIAAIIILHFENKGIQFRLTKGEWIGLIVSALLIFTSFILETPKIIEYQAPTSYQWALLLISEIIGFVILFRATNRLEA